MKRSDAAGRRKADRIRNWPAQERPRERLVAEGAERLTDAELLAIVLRVGRGTFKTGVAGQSAVGLARTLLADSVGFGGWIGPRCAICSPYPA